MAAVNLRFFPLALSLLATPPFFMAVSADCEDGGSRSHAEFHHLQAFTPVLEVAVILGVNSVKAFHISAPS